MMHLGTILDQVALPLQLPEHLGSLSKGIDALIDGFIRDMQ
jgi:hypothetical protein